MSHARMRGMLLSLAFATTLATSSRSGEAPQRVEDPGPLRVDSSLGQYDGARACQRCHSAPLPADDTDYVSLREFTTWSEQDRHAKAFATLKNERSVHMGKLLGIEPTTANACLNCHAANVPKEARAETFTIENGVSCDACHGPSQKWYREHTLPGWRIKPMAEKEKLGFADVRNPVRKTQLCLSCHLGSLPERFVTHEMYAAGHPPLPGFEVAAFCEAMPRHWRPLREKNKPIQELLAKHFQLDPAEHANAKLVVLGGLVTLAHSLGDINNRTDRDAKLPWPELAHFDCYACHHDLKSPAWRQAAGWQFDRPGRPMLRRWPEALGRVGLELWNDRVKSAEGQKYDLSEWMQPLRAAVAAKPFGSRELISEELVRVPPRLLGIADRYFLHSRMGDAEALRLLHLLATWPEKELPDFDSARQLGWAFKIVYDERFPQEVRTGEMHNRVRQALNELDTSLMLRLSPRSQPVGEAAPLTYLGRLNAYDPRQVKVHFQRLKAALPEK